MVSAGSFRAAVAADARSASTGINARACSSSARSSLGKVLSSPEGRNRLPPVIRYLLLKHPGLGGDASPSATPAHVVSPSVPPLAVRMGLAGCRNPTTAAACTGEQ